MSNYTCHAFHDDLPSGRSSALLRVCEGILTFEVADKSLVFPIDQGLSVNMGGANNRLVFFSHSRYPLWQFYVSDRSILNDQHLSGHHELARTFAQARRRYVKTSIVLFAAAVLVIVIPFALLFRMDLLTGPIAKKIPVDWEVALGQSALAQLDSGRAKMLSDESDSLLYPLVSPLEGHLDSSRYTYRYYIIQDAVVNAFALPGGTIVINSGLILEAETAEELLGVLAHELMHIELQHGIRNAMGAAGIYVIVGAIVGDVGGIMAFLASTAPLLLNQSYSRRFEREADTQGFSLLVRSGIDPRGLLRFFAKLQSKEQAHRETLDNTSANPALNEAMSYLSTHPATEKRVAYLTHLIQNQNIAREASATELSEAFVLLQRAVSKFSQEHTSEGKIP